MSAEDHPQMDREEATTGDLALAYTLQTHLCYGHIQPGEMAFRVLRERLDSTGYLLVSEAELAAALRSKAIGEWFELIRHASPQEQGDRLAPGFAGDMAAAIFAALSRAAQEQGETG